MGGNSPNWVDSPRITARAFNRETRERCERVCQGLFLPRKARKGQGQLTTKKEKGVGDGLLAEFIELTKLCDPPIRSKVPKTKKAAEQIDAPPN